MANGIVARSMPLSEIVWDPKIYPRQKWDTGTIERYADAMLAGDVFPPLVLEEGSNRILDGKHRFEAYKKADAKEAPVVIRPVPDGVPVRLFAASLSAKHGDRLSNADVKTIVREVYETNGEFTQKTVAELLGISPSTISGYVADILAKRREDRRAKALRLSLLGWTQQEIAGRLGVAQSLISSDIKKFESEDSDILASGHTPEDIGLRLGLPVQVVLALQFKGLADPDRLKKLDVKVQPYDVWHFNGCHDLMGDKHPGRIPGELVCHALYFLTKSGDLVVDPMAGSGTTLDACLLMGRKARGYDIDGRHGRVDIEQYDLSDGWPDVVKKADLVFWDPPYFDKMDHGTIGDGGYIDGSISGLGPAGYLDWLAQRFSDLAGCIKPGARLAFLMSDWDPDHAKQHADSNGIFLWDYVAALESSGWSVRRQVQCPLPTQQVHPDIVNKFREQRRLARLGRYLLVAER